VGERPPVRQASKAVRTLLQRIALSHISEQTDEDKDSDSEFEVYEEEQNDIGGWIDKDTGHTEPGDITSFSLDSDIERWLQDGVDAANSFQNEAGAERSLDNEVLPVASGDKKKKRAPQVKMEKVQAHGRKANSAKADVVVLESDDDDGTHECDCRGKQTEAYQNPSILHSK
jgi:hypothetical protein